MYIADFNYSRANIALRRIEEEGGEEEEEEEEEASEKILLPAARSRE